MELNLQSFNVEISNGALKGKTLPKRLKVLSWGKNETTDGPVYLTDETLSVFDAWQEKTGRDIDVALDFDHCTVPGSKEYVQGQPKAIAAYGNPVLVKDDGLYLDNLDWTPEGKKNASNYKDLSPAVATDKRNVVVGLHSVALTPNGAVKGLKFYSAQGFEDMIKHMTAKDMGETKPEKLGFSMKSSDGGYNMDGANPSLTKTNNGFKLNEHVLEADKIEHDEDNDECMCAKCKSAKTLSTGNNSSNKTTTKTMSANNPSFPDAYKAQDWQYKYMNDSIIKKMAAEVGMESESDAAKVLAAFLAKYEGLKSEIGGQLTHKENTEEGGLKQFSVVINSMKQEIEALKNEKSEELKRHERFERDSLVKQASKEGRVLTLSADSINKIDINILRELVATAPKTVPLTSTMRVLAADATKKPSRELAVNAFNEMLAK